MTAPKKTLRKRRASTLSGIPKFIKEWFAGEIKHSFYAATPFYQVQLKKYWEAWVEEHPEAVQPDGLEYLMNTNPYPKHIQRSGQQGVKTSSL